MKLESNVWKLDNPLLKILRRGIVHVTSIESYLKIIEDGYIRPNNGNYPYTYPQSKDSTCKCLKAVSVFDFSSISNIQLDCQTVRLNWSSIIKKHDPFTVGLVLCPKKLSESLIPCAKAVKMVENHPIISPVEACYKGDIDITHAIGTFIVSIKGKWNIDYYESLLGESEMEEHFRKYCN